MDQIEKPLSILLIVGAIAYAFMFHTGDGFAAIENNTDAGYTIESAEMSTGYNVTAATLDEGCNVEVQKLEIYVETNDTTGLDSLVVNLVGDPMEVSEGSDAEVVIEVEVTEE